MSDKKPKIARMTERELIQAILALYSKEPEATRAIAHHIAAKLVDRRKLIKEGQ